MIHDPVLRAAIDARMYHRLTGKGGVVCKCGEAFDSKQRWKHGHHVIAAEIEAAQPIWLAQLADEIADEAALAGGHANPRDFEIADWLRSRAAVRTEPEDPADVPWGRLAQDDDRDGK